ncbi:MAG: SoxR reducing system RseC family protein [Deltaproteobacteria bacterium]|nr:SoxR reducing system RseC family protein [Deltaproteobacteria bacterium]
MVTEEGIVTHIGPANNTAWVKTVRSSTCEGCASKDSCESIGNDMKVKAINLAGARVGDRIVLNFQTGALLRATFLLYIFPIICMIGGAIAGQKIAPALGYNSSVMSVFAGFLFFAIAVLIIKIRSDGMARRQEYQPKIIRIL